MNVYIITRMFVSIRVIFVSCLVLIFLRESHAILYSFALWRGEVGFRGGVTDKTAAGCSCKSVDELQEKWTNTHLDSSSLSCPWLISFVCMIAEVTSLLHEERVYIRLDKLCITIKVSGWAFMLECARTEGLKYGLSDRCSCRQDSGSSSVLWCVLPVNTAGSPLYMRKQRLSDTCSAFSR